MIRAAPPPSRRLHDWLAGNADEQVLRWLLRCLVAATIAVLSLDLAGAYGVLPDALASLAPRASEPAAAPGPPITPVVPDLSTPDRKNVPARQADGALAKPMTFTLAGGGRLMASGTITPGSAEAFETELKARGEYVKTIALNSPGGSVNDALAMGRLIRARGLATEVEAGRICVSSCPLVLVGGAQRSAGAKAAIGVHQIFAADPADLANRDAMSDAQIITARCQRYLADMGIDLTMWVHAMETPKNRLFIFSPEELGALKITGGGNAAKT